MLVNLILQGKGGVGKSFIASLLTQHYLDCGVQPLCFDTDPVNQTFAGYPAYNVDTLDIMDGADINQRSFDRLIEAIASVAAEEDEAPPVAVVDNGAATFVPLCSYMHSNEIIPMLRDMGHEVRFHAVITGGQAMDDTIDGFASLCRYFPDVEMAVWINGFFGEPVKNGKSFEQSGIYASNAKRIHSIIHLPALKKETFGQDLEQMMKDRQTFAEAIANPLTPIVVRQRLKMVQRDLWAQMARANL